MQLAGLPRQGFVQDSPLKQHLVKEANVLRGVRRAGWTALLALASWTWADEKTDPGFASFRDECLEKEKDGAWTGVKWAGSVSEAMKQAQSENKPLLFVLIVGHRGKADAAEC